MVVVVVGGGGGVGVDPVLCAQTRAKNTVFETRSWRARAKCSNQGYHHHNIFCSLRFFHSYVPKISSYKLCFQNCVRLSGKSVPLFLQTGNQKPGYLRYIYLGH